MATRDIGLLVIGLGGGRRVATDRVDHRVGLSGMVQRGQRVEAGAPLAMVHAASVDAAQVAIARLQALVAIGGESPAPVGPVWTSLAGS
jgi:thymidine phosphorylase